MKLTLCALAVASLALFAGCTSTDSKDDAMGAVEPAESSVTLAVSGMT